jgi:3-hydroxyisobutyrate dehydrogenase
MCVDKPVGVVGLGHMGSGIARSLLRAGFKVHGFDPVRPEIVGDNGTAVTLVSAPQDLCSSCKIILLSLSKASIVEDVVLGPGGLTNALRAGTTIIDTSTSHPNTTRQLSALLAKRNVLFVDAPVSGGPAAASAGTLSMVLGGDINAIAGATEVLEAITAARTYVGPSGAGHVAKIIGNALCAANLILAAEAVELGKAFGLDPQALIKGLNAGSGRNAATEVNFPRWILTGTYNSGFTMGLMRKDVRLARDLIQAAAIDLPLVTNVIAAWDASETHIADDEDFNRIVKMTLKD